MTMNPNLPEEILIDIFARVPAKSVGKFRCLSKPWRALLTSPIFIKSHLSRQTHQQSLILISQSFALRTISTIRDDDRTVFKKIHLLDTEWFRVVASYNGLVLLLNMEEELFLVNPITKERVNIPHSPLALPKRDSYRIHGFGYDTSNDDYKILTLSCYKPWIEYARNWLVDVYSLKKGVWKRVNSSPYDHTGRLYGSSAFVNGAIHWLASTKERDDCRSVIVAFDFVKEVFYEIPAPPLGVFDKSRFVCNNSLVVPGDSLCFFFKRSRATTEFWMLKEYGKVESWMKFNIAVEGGYIRPLCLIGDEEFVMLTEDWILIVYNVKKRSSKIMVVDGIQIMFVDGITFTDGLVSPDFGKHIEGNGLP